MSRGQRAPRGRGDSVPGHESASADSGVGDDDAWHAGPHPPNSSSRASSVISLLLWTLITLAMAVVVGAVYHQSSSVLADEINIHQGILHPLMLDPVGDVRATPAQAVLQFVSCCFSELALGLDNLAIWGLVLGQMSGGRRIGRRDGERILLLVVLVSLGMRFAAFWLGAAAWRYFDWVPLVFGVFLLLRAVRWTLKADTDRTLANRPAARVLRRVLGVGAVARVLGANVSVFCLLVCLDVLYAADSVPVAFSITRDPFIACLACACVGMVLRSLFAVLGGPDGVASLRYLRVCTVLLLLFFSAKQFLLERGIFPEWITLAVVGGVLGVCLIGSMWRRHAADVGSQPQVGAGGAAAIEPRPAPLADAIEAIELTRRNLRKIGILIAGTLLMCSAAVIGPLPGPGGSIVFFAGLGLLATEFVWARKLLLQLKDQAEKIGQQTDKMAGRLGIWPIPVVAVLYLVVGYVVVRFGILPYSIALAVVGGLAFPIALWMTRMVVAWRAQREGPSGVPKAPIAATTNRPEDPTPPQAPPAA